MKNQKKKNFVEQEAENANKLTFRQAYASLPSVLMTLVIKRILLGVAILILTVIVLFVMRDIMCCVGFLIALLSFYLALDIIWKYGEDKIMVARMYVCKSSRKRKGQLDVILRDAAVTDIVAQDFDTYKYTITAATKADIGNIDAGTIMDIYIFTNNPNAIIAYEILGNA